MRMAAREEALWELEWGLANSNAPALYLLLVPGPASLERVLPAALCGQQPRLRFGPDWLEELTGAPAAPEQVEVIPFALSATGPAQRPALNAARQRLLDARRKLVLIESAAEAPALFRDFPDLLSVAREVFQIQDPARRPVAAPPRGVAPGFGPLVPPESAPDPATLAERAARRRSKLGLLRGQGWIAPDFDGPLPVELQRAFEGEEE